jgi:ABC-2 type transport system permease protein
MISFRRTAAIVVRQFYLLRGSPTRILPLFVWVSVDIILWGLITRYLNSVASSGMDFVPALLGAVLLWDFFIRVMQGVTTAFFEDVWSRSLLIVFGSPIKIPEYLGGLVISGIATSSAGLVLMQILASTIFGLSFFKYGAALIPFLLVLFMFGIALGVAGIAIVLRFGPSAEWLIWPIPALLSPFAAVFYPLSSLPAWMRGVSRLLPPSYVFEAVRAIVASHGAEGLGTLGGRLAIAAGLAALYIVLAAAFFTHIYKDAVRSGLIARYSAESLS